MHWALLECPLEFSEDSAGKRDGVSAGQGAGTAASGVEIAEQSAGTAAAQNFHSGLQSGMGSPAAE